MIGELTRPTFRTLVADLGRLAVAVRGYFAAESRDVENTYAYKAGGKAYYANDVFNPYREDTDSHKNWNDGYAAAEQWEANIW